MCVPCCILPGMRSTDFNFNFKKHEQHEQRSSGRAHRRPPTRNEGGGATGAVGFIQLLLAGGQLLLQELPAAQWFSAWGKRG